MSDDPECPKCGGRHPPRRDIPTPTGKERDKLNRYINKLMGILREQDPEFTLRLLITMLASVAEMGNLHTRQNVVRVVAQNLGLSVVFGIPHPSREDMENWKPGNIKPEDVN